MTKKQKIWLGVFLAMFIVPEVLWGGLLATFFNFKSVYNAATFFVTVPFFGHLMFLAEIAGVSGLIFLNFNYQYKSIFYKYLFRIILLLILLGQLFIAYAYYSFIFVSFP